MDVRTSQDVALIGCCSCTPGDCEAPRKECQSINAVASPAGFTDPADTVWKRYLTKTEEVAYSLSDSTNTTEAEGTDYETTYVSYQRTISANSANVQTYDRLFNASLADGGDCGSWPATMTEECVATGTETIINRDALFATLAEGDPPTAEVVITSQTDITLSNVSGERTVEHIAWEADADAWDVANPDHEAAVEAWQEAHDDWVDAVAQWEIDYQAWIDGGEIGDPPEDPGPEPERPPDRPTEPTEFYPECTFKKTTVETVNDWAFYVYDDPAGEGLVLLDSDVTTSYEYISGLPTWGGTATASTIYGGGQGKAEWIAATKAFLEGEIDFEELAPECLGSECASSIDVGPPDPPEEDPPLPPAPGPDPYIDMVKVRYRRGIPASWADFDGRHAAWVIAHAAWVIEDPETRGEEPEEPTERTTYETQWDEGEFSVDWLAWEVLKEAFDEATREHAEWVAGGSVGDEPDVPDDPGAAPEPVPTLVATRSWIYAPPDEFSEWFVMELPAAPTTPVEILDVNLLVICYRSAGLGQKPTAHGKVHEF